MEDFMLLLEHIKNSFFEFADKYELSRAQLFVLYAIDRHADMGMGQVADVLRCDASNVTGMVDRLVAQGLVMRQESARDRRSKTLRLTAKGEQIIKDFKAYQFVALGCAKLDDAERAALHSIVQKVVVQA